MASFDASLTIVSSPAVRGGEPLIWGTGGATPQDLLDRVDAGDSIEDVAEDFLLDRKSLQLLVALRDHLGQPPTGAHEGSTDKLDDEVESEVGG